MLSRLGDDDAEVAGALRPAPHRIVGVARDAQNAARAVARAVEPQLALDHEEDLTFVVAVHRVAVVGRVLDVLHPGGGVHRPRQRLDPDTREPVVLDPRHVVLVDAKDLGHVASPLLIGSLTCEPGYPARGRFAPGASWRAPHANATV